MRNLKDAILDDLELKLDAVSGWICESMQQKLIQNEHVDTGALLQSIRHEIARGDKSVTSYIIADAKNPKNGAEYAEFIELGTGAAHGRAGGRVGSWRYQDRNGNWRITDGMDADPFIQPSVEEHWDAIQRITDDITYDLEKYWLLKGGAQP